MLHPVSHITLFRTSGEAIKLKMMYINLTLHFRLKRGPPRETQRGGITHIVQKAVARHTSESSPALTALHAEWV